MADIQILGRVDEQLIIPGQELIFYSKGDACNKMDIISSKNSIEEHGECANDGGAQYR